MIGQDKIMHCVGSAIMTVFFGFFINMFVAAGIALAIGIAKELVHDYLLKKGNCEWGDMFANTAGVIVGLGILFLLSIM